MTLLLIIIVVVLLLGGGWGYRSGYYSGPRGPYIGGGLGLIVLILIILLVLGVFSGGGVVPTRP